MKTNNEIDALRYRWMKAQHKLSLETDGSTWTRNGVKFIASHRLSANGTQYGSYEKLDELVDAAISAQMLKNERR